LREPPRGRFQSPSEQFDTDIAWYQAIAQVLSRRTMLHLLVAYGISTWLGAFFMRSHGLSLSEVGAMLGGVVGLASFVGVMVGVVLGPKVVRRDRRWELSWPGAVCFALVPAWMLTLYVSNLYVVATLLAITVAFSSSCVGFILTSLQSVLPTHLRGMGTAAIMFASNLISTGAGPLVIGYLSDALAPTLGDQSLRYAMIIGVTVIGWGAIHFFIAAKHFRNELVS
jgi:hypothetical protein